VKKCRDFNTKERGAESYHCLLNGYKYFEAPYISEELPPDYEEPPTFT
jgi:hypothetical protein